MTAAPESLARTTADPVTLVIGDLSRWRRAGSAQPQIAGFHWADFDMLGAELLQEIRPEVILSPLFSPHFDAMDLAAFLHVLGFAGRYRAVASTLPDVAVVRREVAAVAPSVDFDIFVITAQGLTLPASESR